MFIGIARVLWGVGVVKIRVAAALGLRYHALQASGIGLGMMFKISGTYR